MEELEWPRLLDGIADAVRPTTLAILKTGEQKLEGGTFSYTVPHHRFLERIQPSELEAITNAIRTHLGLPELEVECVVCKQPLAEVAAVPQLPVEYQKPLTASLPLNMDWIDLNEQEFGPDTYHVGGWNGLAFGGAQELLGGHEQILYIEAPPGMGKTHLGQHILLALQANGANGAYIPAPTYMSNAIDTMLGRSDALSFYLRPDLQAFFLDDLQWFVTRTDKRAFECLKVTLNDWLIRGKKLIIGAHDAPASLGFSQDFFGRIAQGLSVKIRKPTVEERLEFLEFRTRRLEHCCLEHNALVELASSVENIRVLLGALKTLNLMVRTGNAPKQGVAEWAQQQYGATDALTFGRILAEVTSISGVPENVLRSSRKEVPSRARHAVVLLALKHLPSFSQSDVARELERTPSTVSSTMRKYEDGGFAGDTALATLLRETAYALGLEV